MLIGGAAGAGVLVALALAATYRPGWYSPVSVDHTRLRGDKRELAALLDEIGAALNAGRPVTFELHADQVQRWIAARSEMWPEAVIDLGPIREVMVLFDAGRVRVGAEVASGAVRVVVSLVCRAEVDGECVRLEYDSVRMGAVPVPRSWVAGMIARVRLSAGTERYIGQDGVIRLRNEWVWPNGRRRCRIAKLALSNGVARVTLEPLAGR